MYLKKTVKLKPNKDQDEIINRLMQEYIKAVNYALDIYIQKGPDEKITSADLPLSLPSSMKTAAIKEAKGQYTHYLRLSAEDTVRILLNPGEPIERRIPYVKHLHAKWSKNTFYLNKNTISLPGWNENHYERIEIKYLMPEEVYQFFETYPPLSVELIWKKKKLLANFTYFKQEPALKCNQTKAANIMGVDLNLKCPAVCVTSENKVLFAGNGRELQYMRRHYKAIRDKLKREGKMKEFHDISGKEKQYMNDRDHKISRAVIDFAIKENITEIHLEKLTGAKQRISSPQKKQREQIATWSYHRLSSYIEYKAKLAGIKVVYVSPVFTSQICPKCQEKTKSIKGGMFTCPVCGYTVHNDLLAAMNIRDRKPIKKEKG